MKNDQWDIDLILKVKKNVIINSKMTIQDLKTFATNYFKPFGCNFNFFVKENEITELDKMNLERTLDYYRSRTVEIVPKSYEDETNRRLNTISDTNTNYLNTEISNEEMLIKEKNYFRKNFLNACEDIDNLKKSILGLKSSNDEENISRASKMVYKTEDIISETDKFLRQYNMDDYANKPSNGLNSNASFHKSYFDSDYKIHKISQKKREVNSPLPTTDQLRSKIRGYEDTNDDSTKFSLPNKKKADLNTTYSAMNEKIVVSIFLGSDKRRILLFQSLYLKKIKVNLENRRKS